MERVIVDREWLDAGIPLAYGSGAPTTRWYKPQITIAAGMARKTISNKTINPEQRLTFQEALRACTMGAAYVAYEENIQGSIEIGKLGDITVWSQDPTGATPNELFDLPDMFMTIIRGKFVHQA